jgi:hypothetical protein
MTFRSLKSTLIPAAATLLAAISLSAMAADAQPGLRVARDAETGALRAPTAEELKALTATPVASTGTDRAAAKASPPRGLITGRINPPEIVHPDGTIEQELDDSTLMYSVARRGADGKLEMYCVPGKEAADQIVKGKKAVARAAKEHKHER